MLYCVSSSMMPILSFGFGCLHRSARDVHHPLANFDVNKRVDGGRSVAKVGTHRAVDSKSRL